MSPIKKTDKPIAANSKKRRKRKLKLSSKKISYCIKRRKYHSDMKEVCTTVSPLVWQSVSNTIYMWCCYVLVFAESVRNHSGIEA